jgi:hypothetical protein
MRKRTSKPTIVSMDDRFDSDFRTYEWRARAADTLVLGPHCVADVNVPCAFIILGYIGAIGMTLTTSIEGTDGVWDAVVHFLSNLRI